MIYKGDLIMFFVTGKVKVEFGDEEVCWGFLLQIFLTSWAVDCEYDYVSPVLVHQRTAKQSVQH